MATAIRGGLCVAPEIPQVNTGQTPDKQESHRDVGPAQFDLPVRQFHGPIAATTTVSSVPPRSSISDFLLPLLPAAAAEDGISSQRLSSTLLWPDKPEDEVKNSRSVTINHLHKTLSRRTTWNWFTARGCFPARTGTGLLLRLCALHGDYRQGSRSGRRTAGELVQLAHAEIPQTPRRPAAFSTRSGGETGDVRWNPSCKSRNGEITLRGGRGTTQVLTTLAETVFCIDPLNDQA